MRVTLSGTPDHSMIARTLAPVGDRLRLSENAAKARPFFDLGLG